MPSESQQITQEDSDNPDGLTSAEQYRDTLKEIFQKNELSHEDRKAIRAMVQLVTFASDCMYIKERIEKSDNEVNIEVSDFTAVKVHGYVHFDPPTKAIENSDQPHPLMSGVNTIIGLFESDQREILNEVLFTQPLISISNHPLQNMLEQLDRSFWLADNDKHTRKRRADLGEERLAKHKESIHINTNAISLTRRLSQCLSNGFAPAKLQKLVFRVNAYLLNHFVEKYGVGE